MAVLRPGLGSADEEEEEARMRYRITNLTRTDDSSKTTGTHAKPATFDIDAVNEAVAHAAARGESLYIRPIAATAAAAPPVPQAV
jgi:hypothetical protein